VQHQQVEPPFRRPHPERRRTPERGLRHDRAIERGNGGLGVAAKQPKYHGLIGLSADPEKRTRFAAATMLE
jgi:hypothetical protein